MQPTINLHREIPPEEFADYFENLKDLKETIRYVEDMYHSLRKEITDHEQFDRKAREQEKVDRENIFDLNGVIYGQEVALAGYNRDKIETPRKKKLINDSYYNKRKCNKIMKRRDGRHAARRVVNKIICAQKKATVLAIEDWVTAVGEWFESGSLGAGTVTYRGKTFTAQ